ncbi:hypothetical protein CKAN_00048300 [Cinnamomum micranthum f. kanehirae]|uniref:Uncharacterized protein n=1 Tax=Cinnamomum micranthum f. kanehirae TaxID=337451 RepID=A0A3S3NNU9_9MAGN|nr:hypothetical protein CKAN_00048300 [Cinnamomum micranthum f. kanehirae]
MMVMAIAVGDPILTSTLLMASSSSLSNHIYSSSCRAENLNFIHLNNTNEKNCFLSMLPLYPESLYGSKKRGILDLESLQLLRTTHLIFQSLHAVRKP